MSTVIQQQIMPKRRLANGKTGCCAWAVRSSFSHYVADPPLAPHTVAEHTHSRRPAPLSPPPWMRWAEFSNTLPGNEIRQRVQLARTHIMLNSETSENVVLTTISCIFFYTVCGRCWCLLLKLGSLSGLLPISLCSSLFMHQWPKIKNKGSKFLQHNHVPKSSGDYKVSKQPQYPHEFSNCTLKLCNLMIKSAWHFRSNNRPVWQPEQMKSQPAFSLIRLIPGYCDPKWWRALRVQLTLTMLRAPKKMQPVLHYVSLAHSHRGLRKHSQLGFPLAAERDPAPRGFKLFTGRCLPNNRVLLLHQRWLLLHTGRMLSDPVALSPRPTYFTLLLH